MYILDAIKTGMLSQKFAITTFCNQGFLRIPKIATIHFMLNGMA